MRELRRFHTFVEQIEGKVADLRTKEVEASLSIVLDGRSVCGCFYTVQCAGDL